MKNKLEEHREKEADLKRDKRDLKTERDSQQVWGLEWGLGWRLGWQGSGFGLMTEQVCLLASTAKVMFHTLVWVLSMRAVRRDVGITGGWFHGCLQPCAPPPLPFRLLPPTQPNPTHRSWSTRSRCIG